MKDHGTGADSEAGTHTVGQLKQAGMRGKGMNMLRVASIVAKHEDCAETSHKFVMGKEIEVSNKPMVQFPCSCRVIVSDRPSKPLHVIPYCCEQDHARCMTRVSLPSLR